MTVLREEFGVTVRTTLIYERTLELTSQLCWNPQDLGLTRVHLYEGTRYRTYADVSRRAKADQRNNPEVVPLFDWLEPVGAVSGVARERYLRDIHWLGREQIVNLLLDTTLQAYEPESRDLLKNLTGHAFDSAELVKVDATNAARKYVGAPDTVFLDERNGAIALIEIKIAATNAKFSVDQAAKYCTMEKLLTSSYFFPGYRVFKILVCPWQHFYQATKRPRDISLQNAANGQTELCVSPEAVHKLKPLGCADFDELIGARLRDLMGRFAPRSVRSNPSLLFKSWSALLESTPVGALRTNLEALMPALSGEESK